MWLILIIVCVIAVSAIVRKKRKSMSVYGEYKCNSRKYLTKGTQDNFRILVDDKSEFIVKNGEIGGYKIRNGKKIFYYDGGK